MLLYSHSFPPKVDGVGIRFIHTLRGLVAQGHTVDVMVLDSTPSLHNAEIKRLASNVVALEHVVVPVPGVAKVLSHTTCTLHLFHLHPPFSPYSAPLSGGCSYNECVDCSQLACGVEHYSKTPVNSSLQIVLILTQPLIVGLHLAGPV